MESVRGRLGSSIVDHVRDCHPRGDRSHGDDHAVVVLAHVRKELLHHPVMRKGVDVEGEADVPLRRVEGLADDDAGVVDQDGGVADLGPDFGCNGGDGLGDVMSHLK